MSITVVLHEATRTGAPKVGGLIAAELQKYEDVRVICLDGGPLLPWLRERIGADRISVVDSGKLRYRSSFNERVHAAEATLREHPSELVYVNSFAAAEFVVAAKSVGRAVVLHLHEKAGEMRKILSLDLAKLEVLAMCDGIVLAADELERDVAEVFGFLPKRRLCFGIAVDVPEIRRLAGDADASACNASGTSLAWDERARVGMCGIASFRKGADLFFEVARRLPAHDFLWIGNWEPAEAPENLAYEGFLAERLPNLYVTGGVDNPYKYIKRVDLFFLSSREDPNPLVLAEAMLLDTPILAFSRATAVADFLGRTAILCHGHTNWPDAVRVIDALDITELRSRRFRGLAATHLNCFDLEGKMEELLEFLRSV